MRLPRSLPPAALVLALLLGSSADAEEERASRLAFEPSGTSLEAALARAGEEGRSVYVDVTSAACGFCRLLEQNVYARPEVREALSAFLCLRFDGEEGAGLEIARRFRVTGFPTLLVVAPDGGEIDRIAGYVPAEAFLGEIQRIRRGEGTLPALRRRLAEAPEDVSAALALGAKRAEVDPAETISLLTPLEARLPAADRATRADLLLTLAIALGEDGQKDRARTLFERLVREFADTPAGKRAGPAGILAFLDAEPERALPFLWAARDLLPDGEVKSYVDGNTQRHLLDALASCLRRQAELVADDPELLNEVAWTCFEHRLLADEATAWARRAVEASGRKAHVLDTLANLLFRQGEAEEAIRLEEEAVAGAPDAASRAEYEETLVVFRALQGHRAARRAGGDPQPRGS